MKKVIVTGSEGLIGKEIAGHLNKNGYHVIRCDLKLGHDLSNEDFVKLWFKEEKNKLATQLQHASKMEMIGQLAAGIAHEINNPLNFITLNAHTILADFNDLCELVDHYRRIIKTGEQIPALAEDISELR